MENYLKRINHAFEIHAAEEIKNCFEIGIDPNQLYQGKPLIYQLINMYYRSPEFKNCIQAFMDYGLVFPDQALLAVLLDDAPLLDSLLTANKKLLENRYTFECTFTPLFETTLLHLCAEYNHLNCAKTLVLHGADINARGGLDPHGFGGQTPIFHTVNQHANNSMDVLKYLIGEQADLTLTVTGLIWGKGYEWETFIPSVNPISYAMMGLLRQFQRTESDMYEVVSILMKARYGITYSPGNIPNAYLK